MNRLSKILLVSALAVLAVTLGWGLEVKAAEAPRVKGIILMIGDGMGINQVRSADIYSRQVLGKPLSIGSIGNRCTTTTFSADSEVTDSSAAATAIYTGYKINNRSMNFLPDGRKLSTIGHAAKKSGLSVGVVSTTRLTHATPAAVYGRAASRNDENLIADQLVDFSPEVAMAGGLAHFIPQSQEGSKRTDGKDLIEAMVAGGYTFIKSADELKTVDPAKTDKLLGVFAMSHLDYDLDRQNSAEPSKQPTLADMTTAAISILERNPKGFFIMIEGGRIDHACHAHDIKSSIYDVIAFDDAVKAALEYQKTHPDVLVIVTADHETGGLGLGRGTEYAVDLAALKPIKSSLEKISYRIKKDPSRINEVIEGAGFELTEKEKSLLTRYASSTGPGSTNELNGYPKIDDYVQSWTHYALGLIEAERAKIGWTSFAHTAQPVITYTSGPGQEEFSGALDNTDIAKRTAKLLGVTLDPPAPAETGSK